MTANVLNESNLPKTGGVHTNKMYIVQNCKTQKITLGLLCLQNSSVVAVAAIPYFAISLKNQTQLHLSTVLHSVYDIFNCV